MFGADAGLQKLSSGSSALDKISPHALPCTVHGSSFLLFETQEPKLPLQVRIDEAYTTMTYAVSGSRIGST